MIQAGNRVQLAHRVSYVLNHGNIEAGRVIRHTCNNRLCVNPSHLLNGTHADNMNDRSLAFCDKVKAKKIRQLRTLEGLSMGDISQRTGVPVSIISEVLADIRFSEGYISPSYSRSGKMTKEIVESSRKAWSNGLSTITSIAEELNLSRGTTADMLYGRSFKDIEVFPHPKTGEIRKFEGRKVVR